MKKEIVRCDNVWVEFDGIVVLKENNLVVYENDFLGIVGPNGGGKTTLLKVILGLVKPTCGGVTLFGDDPRTARKRVGYVPQLSSFDHSFPVSVWDVVCMGRLAQRGIGSRLSATDTDAVREALVTVEMLGHKDKQIGKLSGGERQRVFIARALAGDPELLLLDEPTASVDAKIKTDIYDLLASLKKKMAIVLVTHDMGVISSHVDRIACLNMYLFCHETKELSADEMDALYHCPVDIIAHGHPHRVLKDH